MPDTQFLGVGTPSAPSLDAMVITFRTDSGRELQRIPSAEGMPSIPARGDIVRLSMGIVRVLAVQWEIPAGYVRSIAYTCEVLEAS